ncbi:MAG: DUF4159 domain-containing protein [Opitutus sp.]|nr:DUF4159 domain-containing protein [Opitutus sp.]
MAVAQGRRGGGRGGSRGGGGGGGGDWGEGGWIGEDVRTAREVSTHSTGTPVWTNPRGFEKDVFTFVRVRRGMANTGYRSRGSWSTDTPDSDLNFSYRLQQMTSMKVDPDGRFIQLTDPDLSDYPFIYMVEPGSLYLTDPEIVALRKYLLNGGFLMLDDFWGEREWDNAARVLKEVLPDRAFSELPLTHAVYHCVFEIKAKGQVPSIRGWEWSGGETSERGEESAVVHHRAIFDDKGRMMVIATHNTDNGDGWEREGENGEYFKLFSEKIAYPLGINIIFYSLTH